MCGIAGFTDYYSDYNKEREKYADVLEEMCTCLYHRGPDEFGYILDINYGLAHTRLSIRDIERGKQPMSLKTEDNLYRIIYNGEIYNAGEIRNDLVKKGYVFNTSSDTEVILNGFAEYGIGIAEKLNGIFAFCVVDKRKGETYLVRDQMGVKPLYYQIKDNTVIFS